MADGQAWSGSESGLLVAAILSMLGNLLKWPFSVLAWLLEESSESRYLRQLKSATTFSKWLEAAKGLDKQPEALGWILNPIDKHYGWKHVSERRKLLGRLRNEGNYIQIGDTLRHSLMRHMYNITNLALYKQTYMTTKEEIHLYVNETVAAIRAVTKSPPALATRAGRFSAQDKRILLSDLQKTYGRTALVLQGGSIFGICHLGVVQALDEQAILPNVIVGTATGALMAALVGSKTEQELPDFVCGESLDLSAFANRSRQAQRETSAKRKLPRFLWPMERLRKWLQVVMRRLRRLVQAGFVLDPDALAQCVRDNVGDMTFEEAYKRTGRVLNIVVSSPSEEVPSLMNHLTAPRYLIRSAAMASHDANVGQSQLDALRLLYKDLDGNIRAIDAKIPQGRQRLDRPTSSAEQNNPFRRLRQLFNVEHFIISQARPYIAPFSRPSLPYLRGKRQDRRWIPHVVGLWIRALLVSLDFLNVLPERLHRILSDETIGTGNNITLVPEITFRDWPRLLQNPKQDLIDTWLLKGERAVWPSICALRIRMTVELELQECWDELRQRRTPTAQENEARSTGREDAAGQPNPDQRNRNREAEDRLLKDMQRGVGGFVPGITGMDHIGGISTREHYSEIDGAEADGNDRHRKVPRLILNDSAVK
ncbi:uncharacterized protein MYCFIDRAFT_159511 [Pseudocercospora fijiensis CIRAD86]|uniref:PNPLA domain-containing protein n=1 Tax=Pseudocercospora fijiensis (strain CIRAD86) TaxID=383855 RepID=N1Q6V0_PSEFD|nr:uncharacterized protein MYCFIDRAFT_159511 [Pseudocercospora fijiensis CIRAD86]EME88275.1 hypothetical protein MYCFIDRAFT_159511 [Pseudocercospora fijiensis CIRAD86]